MTTDGQAVVREFNAFRGAGFAPDPASGQLDSDAFVVTGLSDGDLSFGETGDTGDFARGTDGGGASTGGIYAFETGPDDFSLGVQSTGSDFTPGAFVVQYRNQTGNDLTAFRLAYDIEVYNDANRSSSFNAGFATGACGSRPDAAAFTALPNLDFTSPEAADSSASWSTTARETTVSAVRVSDGNCLFVRFASDDAGGSGSRDELALNNLSLTANPPTVQFSGSTGTVNEKEGTTALTVVVSNPDGESVDVDVTFDANGSTADQNDFGSNFPEATNTTSVSFPSSASDGDTRTVPLDLAQNDGVEGREDARFVLQNLSTAGEATIALPSEFTLSLEDDVSEHDGDVLITEFMPAPSTSDSDGEYIELYNATEGPINLNGWTVDPPGDGDTNIDEDLPIPARGFVHLCRNMDASKNGGIDNCDFTQTGALTNSGGPIVVMDDQGAVVDRVNYDDASPWPDFNNAAAVFTGTSQNNDGSNWATASRRERGFTQDGSGSGDPGSPGRNGHQQTLQPGTDITGGAGWRMLSAPMSGVNADTLAQVSLVQGVDGHFPGADANLYRWPGGPAGSTNWDASFAADDDLTGSGAPSGGAGAFIWYVFDSVGTKRTDTPPFTLSVPGTPRLSDQTTDALGEGFHLLGNPYAQAFDIADLNLATQNFQTTVQVWDAESQSYVPVSQSDGGDAYVSPYQGFFVERTESNSATLTFDAAGRRADDVQLLRKTEAPPRIEFRLVGRDEEGSVRTRDDALLLHAPDGSTVGWDLHDASKLTPLSGPYAIAAFEGKHDGATRLQSVASIPRSFPDDGVSLPLTIRTQQGAAVETLTLSWENWEHVPENWRLDLYDAKVDTLINLRTHTAYTFSPPTTDTQSNSSPSLSSASSPSLPDHLYAGASFSHRPNAGSSSGDARFTLQIEPTPFPAELSSFTATAADGAARLQWTTAREANISGFAVQHRPPTSNSFEEVGVVKSKAPGGTTDAPQVYRFDTEPLVPGRHAFRLRQVGLDGTASLSDTTVISIRQESPLRLRIAPNPVRSQSTIRMRLRDTQEATVQLYDLLGRRLRTLHDGALDAGEAYTFQLKTETLPSGTYFLRVTGERVEEVRRITVVR